jgi:hypothetical protein
MKKKHKKGHERLIWSNGLAEQSKAAEGIQNRPRHYLVLGQGSTPEEEGMLFSALVQERSAVRSALQVSGSNVWGRPDARCKSLAKFEFRSAQMRDNNGLQS